MRAQVNFCQLPAETASNRSLLGFLPAYLGNFTCGTVYLRPSQVILNALVLQWIIIFSSQSEAFFFCTSVSFTNWEITPQLIPVTFLVQVHCYTKIPKNFHLSLFYHTVKLPDQRELKRVPFIIFELTLKILLLVVRILMKHSNFIETNYIKTLFQVTNRLILMFLFFQEGKKLNSSWITNFKLTSSYLTAQPTVIS